MFRGFVAGVLATIVVALVGGYIVLRSGLIPTNADAKPGWLEIWAANTSLQASRSGRYQRLALGISLSPALARSPCLPGAVAVRLG